MVGACRRGRPGRIYHALPRRTDSGPNVRISLSGHLALFFSFEHNSAAYKPSNPTLDSARKHFHRPPKICTCLSAVRNASCLHARLMALCSAATASATNHLKQAKQDLCAASGRGVTSSVGTGLHSDLVLSSPAKCNQEVSCSEELRL